MPKPHQLSPAQQFSATMFSKVVLYARAKGFIPSGVHRADTTGFTSYWRLTIQGQPPASAYIIIGKVTNGVAPIQLRVGRLTIIPAKTGGNISVTIARETDATVGATEDFDSTDKASRRAFVDLMLTEVIKVFNPKPPQASAEHDQPTSAGRPVASQQAIKSADRRKQRRQLQTAVRDAKRTRRKKGEPD